MSKKCPDEAVFEFATFLVASARGCIEEPHLYGPFRLLDAFGRFVEMCRGAEWYTPDAFLDQAKRAVDENKGLAISDSNEFRKFMDTLVRDFAKELKRRAAGFQQAHISPA